MAGVALVVAAGATLSLPADITHMRELAGGAG
jgi:hypothetical protein